ncbi:cyclic nucleotide-binding domain-containing protein [Halovulum marinum]|uniref:cyclic nucleotide-binding domain-containing protein n=1 Tax=Halovulum marinum TaxID=2662447 RepID=UPI002D7A3D17|nr:cyclic nucleotide-binding domain-containing protein [Halovulum marinum]
MFAEGDPAGKVFLLRQGDVAVEIATSERSPIIVETLHAGDVLGWAWMVPPYRHMSDARAVSDVRAVSLGATCMRAKCDANPVLGYRMFQHLLPHMAARVQVLRLQLLDMYGPKEG